MTPEEIAKLPYRPCVGIMLINRQGLIFTAQRLDNPEPAWQMPQGGIDPGEGPRIAALRELGEETGLTSEHVEIIAENAGWLPYDLPHDLVPKLWKGRFRGQEQKWFLMRFLGDDSDINIETETPEFSEWRWSTADQLVNEIVPFKREIYATLVAEFGDHLCSEQS